MENNYFSDVDLFARVTKYGHALHVSFELLSTCLLSCLGASNGTMADDDGYCLSCVGHEQQPAPSGQNLFVADSPGAG